MALTPACKLARFRPSVLEQLTLAEPLTEIRASLGDLL